MRSIRRSTLGLLSTSCALVVAGGCALQAPLSEGLVSESPAHRRGGSALRPVEVGLPLSGSFPSSAAVRRATPEDRDAEAGDAWRIGLPFPAFVFRPSDRASIAFSPGAGVVGLDLALALLPSVVHRGLRAIEAITI